MAYLDCFNLLKIPLTNFDQLNNMYGKQKTNCRRILTSRDISIYEQQMFVSKTPTSCNVIRLPMHRCKDRRNSWQWLHSRGRKAIIQDNNIHTHLHRTLISTVEIFLDTSKHRAANYLNVHLVIGECVSARLNVVADELRMSRVL